jgi:hypothetical protein
LQGYVVDFRIGGSYWYWLTHYDGWNININGQLLSQDFQINTWTNFILVLKNTGSTLYKNGVNI